MIATPAQLVAALEAQGATPLQAAIGAAIAMAESGGNTQAVCLNCAGVQENSQGAWQINLNAHPGISSACAQDLTCSAAAVKGISNNFSNWNPWTTFTGGAFKSHLSAAAAAAGVTVDQVLQHLGLSSTTTTTTTTTTASDVVPLGPPTSVFGSWFAGLGGALGGAISKATDVPTAIQDAVNRAGQLLTMIGLIALGALLLVLGLVLVMHEQAEKVVTAAALEGAA